MGERLTTERGNLANGVVQDQAPAVTAPQELFAPDRAGPIVKYNFQIGQTPVSSSFRWFHEFNVENRLEGDSALLTLAIPLSGAAR
jgi:hypothetical protein